MPERRSIGPGLPQEDGDADAGELSLGKSRKPFDLGSASRIDGPMDHWADANRRAADSGFALVSLVALVPLLVTLATAVSGLYYVLRHKLTAQSVCVQTAILLQRELREDLAELLKLNPKARRLQNQRRRAQQAVQAALRTGNPLLIQIAHAQLAAVTAEQLALRARQDGLLQNAGRKRMRSPQVLRSNLRGTRHGPIDARAAYPLPLAVAPKPPGELTPEYEPVPQFSKAQQHRFQFRLELAPEFLRRSFVQETVCAASLQREGEKWREILTAGNR